MNYLLLILWCNVLWHLYCNMYRVMVKMAKSSPRILDLWHSFYNEIKLGEMICFYLTICNFFPLYVCAKILEFAKSQDCKILEWLVNTYSYQMSYSWSAVFPDQTASVYEARGGPLLFCQELPPPIQHVPVCCLWGNNTTLKSLAPIIVISCRNTCT